MRKLAFGVAATVLLLGTLLAGTANAQEVPVCGPPGGNNDTCSGGPGVNVIQNCEITS